MATLERGPSVFIVDDDEAAGRSLLYLLSSVGLEGRHFHSPLEFLSQPPPEEAACVVCDVCMPEMNGIAVLEEARARGWKCPFVILTAFGDVKVTVRAFKSGAVDLIEKPYSGAQIIETLQRALTDDRARVEREQRKAESSARLDLLTARERDVLGLLLKGLTNKEMASQLSISVKTIEVHRARVMRKIGARSSADLALRVVDGGGASVPGEPAEGSRARASAHVPATGDEAVPRG